VLQPTHEPHAEVKADSTGRMTWEPCPGGGYGVVCSVRSGFSAHSAVVNSTPVMTLMVTCPSTARSMPSYWVPGGREAVCASKHARPTCGSTSMLGSF
jgi:hypothetical protein